METKNRIPELTRKVFKHHKKEPVDDYEEDQSYDSTDDETDKKKKFCDNHSKGYGTSVTKKGSVGGGVTPPCCQAEKCSVDLTEAKRYHRRHKVCEHHSKAPVVIVAGLRQRFCQQCSRFHELFEFDETKRSCRRRLAGHNERRRKNSSESNGEASSRKSPGSQLKENHCRQADQTVRLPMNLPENTTFKHFQIR